MKGQQKIQRIHFESIPSTNEYAKTLRAQGQDVVITADCQTRGRGTKGRSFSSDVGGVYLTKLTFYQDFPAREAFKIMASTAVAVCETLEFYGLQPTIKWVNDIYVNDKKICGILIENVFSGNTVSSSIVGVGVNVNNILAEDLTDIATTMSNELQKKIPIDEVRDRLIEKLSEQKDVGEYVRRIGYMGRKATVICGEERIPVTLLSVDNEGGLWADVDGEKRRFSAAEVSLRL